MRSLPFPRRLQLVKLLRAHGLRDVERLREDELKEALARLSILLPDAQGDGAQSPFGPAANESPPSSTMGGKPAEPPPPPSDDDDPHALPRFREPRLFLPDHERTFLRLIAVKPRLLYFTWDTHKDIPRDVPAQLRIFVRDYLGDAPAADDVAAQHPSVVVDIDVKAPGWYVELPGERCAVVAALVVDGQQVAVSNMALTTPARPAPPGPLWMATLPIGTSRRALRNGGLLRPRLPDGAALVVAGEARRLDMVEEQAPASGEWMRARTTDQPSLTTSNPTSNPSSGSLPSSSSSSKSSSSLSLGRNP